MTPTDYRNAGYRVSMQLEQAIVNRQEARVFAAYVKPILPNETVASTDVDVKAAIMALTVAALSLDDSFVTRSGARAKNTPNASTAKTTESILQISANECDRLLEVLRAKTGAVKAAEVDDVLGLYFKSNYFYR